MTKIPGRGVWYQFGVGGGGIESYFKKEYTEKTMKRNDVVKKLEAAGYRLDRTGNHAIYEKPGSCPVQVPNHRELNEYTAKAILKAAGIEWR